MHKTRLNNLVGIILITLLLTGTLILGKSMDKYHHRKIDTDNFQVWAIVCTDNNGIDFIAEYVAENKANLYYEEGLCKHLSTLR